MNINQKPTRKRRILILTAIHAAMLFLIPAFGIYKWIVSYVQRYFPFIIGCATHDILKLYCPFCGGTRAISELLHGNIISSLKANALVVILVVFLLYIDIKALIAIIRNEKTIFNFTKKTGFIIGAVIIIYFILRNVLLVGFGIDHLGDLIRFYQ